MPTHQQRPKSKIHAITKGEGAPILCLSGFGCDHYTFLDLAQHLPHYQLILLDNRGMGKSEPAQADYTIEDLALDALEFMGQQGFETFSVIGISMGGFIAQVLTQLAPERVNSLSLLCTTGLGHDFQPIPMLITEQIEKFYQSDLKTSMPIAVDLTTHPSLNQSTRQHIIATRIERIATCDQVLLQKKAIQNFFTHQKINYNEFNLPTLILSGDSDRFVDPVNSEKLHQKIKKSQLTFIPNTDHFFFMEKPKEVAQRIQRFIQTSVYQENSCQTHI